MHLHVHYIPCISVLFLPFCLDFDVEGTLTGVDDRDDGSSKMA